ncbi:hypothetical protein [Pontibacter mangrovi]|uniref:Uncharacterized protein n=1 Tax=Pontibacter mangrovi TaxID=2589816 RepID=A0A501W980_9BACT|nr:hypothetical protein [Pontibacter mangrovi]TPE44920.1 hypothetical protein FJM65_07860 [Pontibacter mangrovi]
MRALLFVLILMALVGCNSIQGLFSRSTVAQAKPFVQSVPDTTPTPVVSPNGWQPVRSTPTEIIWLPPLAQPVPRWVKNKNVGNTTVKNSGNTSVKDKSKEKPKVKDSGNADSFNTAKQAGVIGDNSRSDQKKGIPPLLIYIVLALVVLGIIYYIIQRFFRLPRGGS